MTTLRQALYGIALLGALGLLLWGQYQQSQAVEARETLATERQQQAEQHIEQQASVISALDQALLKERSAQAALRTTHNQLRRGLSARERQIQELKRENADLRQWAEQPLPAAARRLRQRPAITGAAAYRDWLSGGGALRPPGDQPSP
jgi:LysB family phage lysis regulatory protein